MVSKSWRRDLNPQPADYKSAALPIELTRTDRSFADGRSDQYFWAQRFLVIECLRTTECLPDHVLEIKLPDSFGSVTWSKARISAAESSINEFQSAYDCGLINSAMP